MTDHRVRLQDADLDLICAALRARAAMASGARRRHINRLELRLAEMLPGNPVWRLGLEQETRPAPEQLPSVEGHWSRDEYTLKG